MTESDFDKSVSGINNCKIIELDIARFFSHYELSAIPDEKIIQGLDKMLDCLFGLCNSICIIFDNADPLRKLEPKYSIQEVPDIATLKYLLAFLCVLEEYSTRHSLGSYSVRIIELMGRFTVLYANNKAILISPSSDLSTIFKDVAEKTIKLISSYSWDFDGAVQLRLTVMNLMYLQGLSSKESVSEFLSSACREPSDICEYNIGIIKECSEWYLSFVSAIDNNQSIISVDPSWFYVYIFKKRFGFIYCKKMMPISIPPYRFKTQAKSPCFKSLSSCEIGIGSNIIAVHVGSNRRSSEYRPTETSCLYNFSTMKYE